MIIVYSWKTNKRFLRKLVTQRTQNSLCPSLTSKSGEVCWPIKCSDTMMMKPAIGIFLFSLDHAIIYMMHEVYNIYISSVKMRSFWRWFRRGLKSRNVAVGAHVLNMSVCGGTTRNQCIAHLEWPLLYSSYKACVPLWTTLFFFHSLMNMLG